MIATFLPRTGFVPRATPLIRSPERFPGGLLLPEVDPSIAQRDGTFFNTGTGALSGYAKVMLVANATRAAGSTLVLLLSWYVSSSLSQLKILAD
jgi:hypothetical protein